MLTVLGRPESSGSDGAMRSPSISSVREPDVARESARLADVTVFPSPGVADVIATVEELHRVLVGGQAPVHRGVGPPVAAVAVGQVGLQVGLGGAPRGSAAVGRAQWRCRASCVSGAIISTIYWPDGTTKRPHRLSRFIALRLLRLSRTCSVILSVSASIRKNYDSWASNLTVTKAKSTFLRNWTADL